MFERLQKPFLTVETGEAYQPIRLAYEVFNKHDTLQTLNKLECLEKKSHGDAWNWYWKAECEDLHFESLNTYQKNTERPLRLGSLILRDHTLYINLPCFKRACLAVPFFHRVLNPSIARIVRADFINKVFGLDERLPHGFTELFKDEELESIVAQRLSEFARVEKEVEEASSAEEALSILATYTETESQKRLPFAERYIFDHDIQKDPDVLFLSFYIYLRARELVAIHRWFGESGYSFLDAADDAMQQVFGDMDIDIID